MYSFDRLFHDFAGFIAWLDTEDPTITYEQDSEWNCPAARYFTWYSPYHVQVHGTYIVYGKGESENMPTWWVMFVERFDAASDDSTLSESGVQSQATALWIAREVWEECKA